MADVGHVVPVDQNAGGPGHGDQVQGVVGRAAGRHQADNAIDHGFFVNDFAKARLALQGALGGGAGQSFTQLGSWRDKGGAGQVRAHGLHQHLIGIGRAIEGAGSGTMIGGQFRIEQGVAADLAPGEGLAHLGLFLVGNAGGHRTGRREDDGQVAEAQGPDHQSRNNLVAHAQNHDRVEHVVGQGHRRRKGDHVAGEQRQLHTGLALRHAVAHGGHAARHLGRAADFSGGFAQDRRIGLERLVR